MKALVRFVKNESAATAIEYAVIASMVSIAIFVGVEGVGSTLNSTYTTVANALK